MLIIEKRSKLYAGEIGAVVGLKFTITGDTFVLKKIQLS
jgi:translation elongation factor EF-G